MASTSHSIRLHSSTALRRASSYSWVPLKLIQVVHALQPEDARRLLRRRPRLCGRQVDEVFEHTLNLSVVTVVA